MTDVTINPTDLLFSDPTVEDTYRGNTRSISYKWLLFEEQVDNGYQTPEWWTRRVYAELQIEHHGKPDYGNRHPLSMTATLCFDDKQYRDGMYRMIIGIGLPRFAKVIAKQDGVTRFNRKRLEEFGEQALVELRNLRDDETVQAVFGTRG